MGEREVRKLSEGEQKPGPRDAEAITSKITNGEVKLANRRLAKTEKKSTLQGEKTKEAPTGMKSELDKQTKKGKKKVEAKTTKEVTFPVAGFVNKYHFMRINSKVLAKLGWPEGVKLDVTLDVKDGALIVKKKP